jgi:integrase
MPDACDVVRLLLLTGARKSEILGLGWDRVAGTRAVLEDSKSGPRTIWLNTPARAVLERRRERAAGAFVFPSTRADKPLPTIDRQWKAILNAAGIPALRLHDLRHHFAAVGVSNGIDLKVVGQLLGHHDIDTTLGYAHLATAALTKSASRVSGYIDRSLNGAPARNARKKRTDRAAVLGGSGFAAIPGKEAANA